VRRLIFDWHPTSRRSSEGHTGHPDLNEIAVSISPIATPPKVDMLMLRD